MTSPSSVSSSISTYLDVTRASEGKPPVADRGAAGTVAVDEAAKILVAVRAGTELVSRLPEATGFDLAHVFALVGLMAESGLIGIEPVDDGSFRVRLTDEASAALTA